MTTSPTGWPSYYFEVYAGMAQVFATQLTSITCEGVFDQFPVDEVAPLLMLPIGLALRSAA